MGQFKNNTELKTDITYKEAKTISLILGLDFGKTVKMLDVLTDSERVDFYNTIHSLYYKD